MDINVHAARIYNSLRVEIYTFKALPHLNDDVLWVGYMCVKHYNVLKHVHVAGEADELMTVSDKQTSGQHTTADGESSTL